MAYVLHVVPDSVANSRKPFHGSTKDVRGRTEYFRSRGVAYREFLSSGRSDAECLAYLKNADLSQCGAVFFEYETYIESLRYLRDAHPGILRVVRAHNANFPHFLDNFTGRTRLKDNPREVADVRMALERFEQDCRCAELADVLLAITPWEGNHYWSPIAKGRVVSAPYFLPRSFELKPGKKRNVCVCFMGSGGNMTPLLYDAGKNAVDLINASAGSLPGWEFLITGTLKPKDVLGALGAVRPTGLLPSPFPLLQEARVVVLLSDLGMGFKTKILEAIVAGCWVVVTPDVWARLPEEVKPWCKAVGVDAQNEFVAAIQACAVYAPAGDPNRLLRDAAFRALDGVLAERNLVETGAFAMVRRAAQGVRVVPEYKPRRLVWAYDRDHVGHRFLQLGLSTLIDAGWSVTMVAQDGAPTGSAYRCDAAYSNATRKALHEHTQARVHNLKLQENEYGQEADRAAAQAKLPRAGAKRHRSVVFLVRSWKFRLQQRWFAVRRIMEASAMRARTVETWAPHLRAFVRMMRMDGEVYIASGADAAIATCFAAKLRGKRFVYYPLEVYGERVGRASRLLAAFERALLAHVADAVITQNAERAKLFVRDRGARAAPAIVRNFKRVRVEARRSRLREAVPALAGKRVALYQGTMIRGRCLEQIAQAADLLPQDVVIVFQGNPEAKWSRKTAHIIKPRVEQGRLHILPPAPASEMLDYCADADLGIVAFDVDAPEHRTYEPSELADYVSVGTPVIAPDFPTVAPLVRQYDIGCCFVEATPEAIAEAIFGVLRRPRADWREALARASKYINWDTQAPTLVAVANGDAAPAPAGPQPSEVKTLSPMRPHMVEQ